MKPPTKFRLPRVCLVSNRYRLEWGKDTLGATSLPRALVDEVTGAMFNGGEADVLRAMHLTHLAESTYVDPILFNQSDEARARLLDEVVGGMVRSFFACVRDQAWDRRKHANWHLLAGVLWWEHRGKAVPMERLVGATTKTLGKAYPDHAAVLARVMARSAP